MTALIIILSVLAYILFWIVFGALCLKFGLTDDKYIATVLGLIFPVTSLMLLVGLIAQTIEKLAK